MNQIVFSTYAHSPAIDYAATELKKLGYSFCDINRCTHLLLPIPSTSNIPDVDGKITLIGGNLNTQFPTIDLLKDAQYLAQNAMITAHCAIKIAVNKLDSILSDNRILIIGWGRIGKCLAQLLRQINCPVTVAARKITDRAILTGLGYEAIDIDEIDLTDYSIVFNTAPELLFPDCTVDSLLIDLASKPGLTGDGVIVARGLPGKEAPASSGKLIAATIHRILQNMEVL